MDDEARIRIFFVCALAVVLVFTVPALSIAWHSNTADHDANGPQLASISVCRSLPADQRESCLAHLNEATVVSGCTNSEVQTNNDDPKPVPDAQGQAEIDACIVAAAGGKPK